MYDKYESPLSSRYASEEMLSLFSQRTRIKTWRRLWTALAEAEMKMGLGITEEQVEELRAHQEDIDYELVALMLEGFSEQARSRHLFQKYSLQAIFLNHVFVIIRGFCTQKGIGFLDEFMKSTN